MTGSSHERMRFDRGGTLLPLLFSGAMSVPESARVLSDKRLFRQDILQERELAVHGLAKTGALG